MNVPQIVNPKNSTNATIPPPPREKHGDEDVANHFSRQILGIEMTKRNPRRSKNREKLLRRGVRPSESPSDAGWLYGIHAVTAALANPLRRIERLVLTRAAWERCEPKPHGATPEFVERESLDALLPPGAVHQGMALLAPALEPVTIEDICADPPESGLVIVLDQVTDPQNAGAIMRSAAAFGANAMIVQDRNAPPVTGALAKAASGAVETLPYIRVTNLTRAMDALKDSGFWCVGLDGDAESSLSDVRLDGRVALIMGAEGSGLRRLTAERCDICARLPTEAGFGTLNVSAAAAVALYEVARRRVT